ETTTSGTPATARPYLTGGLAALSAGAAAIHFAVTFEHFNENLWYGVAFLVIAWAQLIRAAVAVWRRRRGVAWAGDPGGARRPGGLPGSAQDRAAVRPGPRPHRAVRRAGRDLRAAGARAGRRVRGTAVAAIPRRPAGPSAHRLRGDRQHGRDPRRGDRGHHGGDDPRLGRSRGAGRHGAAHDGVVVRGGPGSAARHG